MRLVYLLNMLSSLNKDIIVIVLSLDVCVCVCGGGVLCEALL